MGIAKGSRTGQGLGRLHRFFCLLFVAWGWAVRGGATYEYGGLLCAALACTKGWCSMAQYVLSISPPFDIERQSWAVWLAGLARSISHICCRAACRAPACANTQPASQPASQSNHPVKPAQYSYNPIIEPNSGPTKRTLTQRRPHGSGTADGERHRGSGLLLGMSRGRLGGRLGLRMDMDG